MPMKTIHCRVCKAAISGEDFAQRMAKLRTHYSEKHPRIWKESIRRGVRKRKEARKTAK